MLIANRLNFPAKIQFSSRNLVILHHIKSNVFKNMSRKVITTLLIILLFASISVFYTMNKKQLSPLVLITDFGMKDGAVAAMKGVSLKLSPNLVIHDLTHEIPAYNIWEGAYRLEQTSQYWAEGTVFVGVIDPGVGTERKSIVLKTKRNHYFVGPDNGLFSLVAESEGIEEVREISAAQRLPNSQNSYTFHGRDVYAYTGAKLAAGLINFDKIGNKTIDNQLVMIQYTKATIEKNKLNGGLPILDIQYGNVWTNIDALTFKQFGLKIGENYLVKIYEKDKLVVSKTIQFVNTFGDVKEGENLLYINSLLNISVGINQGNFAKKYKIGSGKDWKIEISKIQ